MSGHGGDIASDRVSAPQGKSSQNAAAATALTPKFGLEITAARRAFSLTFPVTQRDVVDRRSPRSAPDRSRVSDPAARQLHHACQGASYAAMRARSAGGITAGVRGLIQDRPSGVLNTK